jgi:RNA-directed DNA polymerase
VEVLLSERTKRNAMDRVRQLTPRTWASPLASCITQLNAWLRGWHAFFGIASAQEMQMVRKIDAHLRRRLRAILLRYWKRKGTIVPNVIALDGKRAAWKGIYSGHKSWWALSHSYPVDQGLRTWLFTGRGLRLLVDIHHRQHQEIVAPVQLQLVLWEYRGR